MARTVNEQEYAIKRAEILDAAQSLMYRKGFDLLTIKDIIDVVKISKGAFYHYFESKEAVFEALLQRMASEGEKVFVSLLENRDLPTIPKLQHLFDAMGRWKTQRKTYILSLMRVWYADENAAARLRLQESVIEHNAPLLARIIGEGVEEGVLSPVFPDIAANMVLVLLTSIGNAFLKFLYAPDPIEVSIARAERLCAAYNDAVERILGAPSGSLHLIDAATIREWFDSVKEHAELIPATAGGSV